MEQAAFKTPDAAKYLNVTPRCLVDWRNRRIGPKYAKIGSKKSSHVMYRRSDLDAFLEAHLVDRSQPTANQ